MQNGERYTQFQVVNQANNVKSNAHALARYAAIVQEGTNGSNCRARVAYGSSHSIDKCYDVTSRIISECYKELKIHKINLKGTVLKPNMILPGMNCKQKSSTEEWQKNY